ncbi:MAG TPA: dethiobiotin synthase [Kofleriaceae bacterium]|nr:dethiobiotin synthase [Kofleriaceae bacterium]
MRRAFFVTGTDTGVGKTTVACALLAAARARGLTALGHKPVESGCAVTTDGALLPEDALRLARAAGRDQPPGRVLALRAPLAPAVAAELEGVTIDLTALLLDARAVLACAADLTLVEGAGGLRVPLSEHAEIRELVSALELPLLVIARDGLGTINHTLLTIEAAHARGIPVAGVVLNGVHPGTPAQDIARNAQEIARRSGGVRVLGTAPHGTPPVVDEILDALLA